MLLELLKPRLESRDLKALAEAAGVAYQPLWRWVSEKTESYHVDDAERVYFHLTGEHFTK